MALGCMVLMLLGLWRGSKATESVIKGIQWVLIPSILACLVLPSWEGGNLASFEGLILTNTFTRIMDIFILGLVFIMVTLYKHYGKLDHVEAFEAPLLLLFAALGMMVMISADSLLSLYMGLEIQSLALYVLVALNREHGVASEAAVKYFVLGALASCLILFGTSYLYGFVGSTGFEALALGLKAEAVIPPMVVVAMVLIVAGIAFKMAAVPFHMWAPDIYEGSPWLVMTFVAGAPKIAAFSVLLRLLTGPFAVFTDYWQSMVGCLAVGSVVVGAYGALYQQNLRRLLAYSSIAHAGYGLMGLLPGTLAAVESVLAYLGIYMVTLMTTCVGFLTLRKREQTVSTLKDLVGLGTTHPPLAFCLGVMMFSLAGVPPVAGFFAKFSVLRATVVGGYVGVAVVGVLTSVVGAVYYLRIIKMMYFESQEPSATATLAFEFKGPVSVKVMMVVGTVLVSILMVAPQVFLNPFHHAARSLFLTP